MGKYRPSQTDARDGRHLHRAFVLYTDVNVLCDKLAQLVGRTSTVAIVNFRPTTVASLSCNDDVWLDALIRQGNWPIPLSERTLGRS